MLSPTRRSPAFRRRRRHCALNVLLPLVGEARLDLTTLVRAEAARSTRSVAVRNRASVVESPRLRPTSPLALLLGAIVREWSLCPRYAAPLHSCKYRRLHAPANPLFLRLTLS